MIELKSVKKTTNNRYLDIYKTIYNKNGCEYEYEVVSRRKNIDELTLSGVHKVDSIKVMPYIVRNGKMYLVLIKEFRYPINQYIYSFPAGLVDEGETPRQAVVRELREETGGIVKSIKQLSNLTYTSAGMSDESQISYIAELKGFAEQQLDRKEIITTHIVSLAQAKAMLKTELLDIQTILMLKYFICEQKLKEYQKRR